MIKVKVTHQRIKEAYEMSLMERKNDEDGSVILDGELVDECKCTCHTTRPYLKDIGKCDCEEEPKKVIEEAELKHCGEPYIVDKLNEIIRFLNSNK